MQDRRGFRVSRTNRAFTLIDLAILLGVLAVCIAAALLPALARAREEARRMKCKGNLRNLGTGMIQYIDQYGKGRYYTWPNTEKASFNGSQWIASMYWTSLLNEPDLYLCPSSVDDNDDGGELGRKFTTIRDMDVSYAGRDGRLGVIVDKMPSNTVMMCDDTDDPPNHDDGVNMLYFDAHVEWSSSVSSRSIGEAGKATIGKDSPVDMQVN
jgi:prepilin-type processing-associated H-X9-DG protein